MSSEESTAPAEKNKPVANIDWAALLSSEDLANLAGFFDVLIEMDFEQKQRNKQGAIGEINTKSSDEVKPSTD
ncbi:MAG TPA: hypothetical protein VGF75_02690 [Candidatus Saccharimonadales bacterium]|jgi:hypothetical protein